MQMISKNTLSQIFKEHNIEVDRISKIRTTSTSRRIARKTTMRLARQIARKVEIE